MARILVIDDELPIRQIVRRVLEQENHEISEAANGLEGIRMIREETFDLIITDIVMPEKEGLEMIMELNKEFPDLKIMAISGGGPFDPDMYLEMAKKFGAVHALAKPFRKAQLLVAVEIALK